MVIACNYFPNKIILLINISYQKVNTLSSYEKNTPYLFIHFKNILI